MTTLQKQLLEHISEEIASLDQQLELMASGAIHFRRGSEDATDEAIALARTQRAALQAVIDGK